MIFRKNRLLHHKKICLCIVLLLFMFSFFGCGAKKPILKFVVKADESTNNGQPVYLVVRTVNSSNFVTEDYQSVAGIVMLNPPDETVISTNLILPGENTDIEFDKPDNRSIAVYCMFTNPEQWKVFMQKPLEKKYKFILENNSIFLKGMPR
ncbi:MAG: hypothetical protein KKE44_14820 [Proteobacteria bacterium]|nr:hypothetical protein [Pseudomonadota bacterium]MBU1584001.1 hypothetical protein [Pseudomonadota bacterium]MBU2455375.1 hypothetical protein [Pseudomonadota bacterium]MBU2631485.1 hypothetical protein [Pseudomonadota bacterium]